VNPDPAPDRAYLQLRLLALLAVLSASLIALPWLLAEQPSWWAQRQVIKVDPNTQQPVPADDYAVANQGQLKQIATAAFAEFQFRLGNIPGGIGDMTAPDGVGYRLTQLISGFQATLDNPTPQTDDFATVNLGQLKNVAVPFYDRLIEIGYLNEYPWADGLADDFALANIGQVKHIFSFDLASTNAMHDADQNGLPDWWERIFFGSTGVDPNADPDGDGLTNIEEAQQQTNPNQADSTHAAYAFIAGGDGQTGLPGRILAWPLKVLIKKDGQPLPNAAVQFQIQSGGAQMASDADGTTLSNTLEVFSGADGIARAFLKLPDTTRTLCTISAGPDGAPPVTFSALTVNAGEDILAPTEVRVTRNPNGRITVTWLNHATDATHLKIQRTVNGSEWRRIAILPADSTSFIDTPPDPDRVYFYRVIASREDDGWETIVITTGGINPEGVTEPDGGGGGGGGGGGSGPSEPGATDPEMDPDGDGLTNAEEAEERTSPENPNTDGDEKIDGEDAVAKDINLYFDRVPKTGYALIELGEGTSLGMNDNGQVLVQSGSQYKMWEQGEWTNIPLKEVQTAGAAISEDGTVIGYKYAYGSSETGEHARWGAAKWSKATGVTELAVPSTQIAEADAAHTEITLNYLTAAGSIFGAVERFYQDGELYDLAAQTVSWSPDAPFGTVWATSLPSVPATPSPWIAQEPIAVGAEFVNGITEETIEIDSATGGYTWTSSVSTIMIGGFELARWDASSFGPWRGDPLPPEVPNIYSISPSGASQVMAVGTAAGQQQQVNAWIKPEGYSSWEPVPLYADADRTKPAPGAGPVNKRGEILMAGQLWQNGRIRDIKTMLSKETLEAYTDFTFVAINKDGTIAATAKKKSDGKTYAIQVLPVEILNKEKKAISKLKVGKMADTGVLSGSGSSAALDIDKDSDRFYVRIPGAANMGTASIKVATVENPDGSYNDGETEIDLQVEGNDLISKSMLLVSDDVDDDHSVDGVADDAKNDRTHKIQLGGKLQVKSLKLGGTEHSVDVRTPVPVEKTVTFGVVILRNKAQASGGTPVLPQADVETDLKIAQERYAQMGIKLAWSISIADPPPGVDLSDGLTEYTSNTPTPEEKSLLDGLATAADNDMQAFYVNFMSQSSYGESFSKGQFTNAADVKYTGNVVVSSTRRSYVLAHELGHILTNTGNHHPETINLMHQWVGASTGALISEAKRLDAQQQQIMRANPLSK
jgi:hypothetical protein